MNGWRLDVAEHEAAAMVERVAQGTVDEDEFTRWLQENAQPGDA
jgi:prophage maintenance system killer protein